MRQKERIGLIVVNTGNGKGKTSAALGVALRSVGHDYNVVMIQFIKGAWMSGEVLAAKRLAPNLEILPMGRGFIISDKQKAAEKNRQMVRTAWEVAKEKALSGLYDVVILDEITYTMSYGMLPVEEVVQFLREKPPKLHVIITGRGAPQEIVDLADLVTEMTEIKHPFQKGIKAQEGIDY
ncbi:MAG: cob(I)yrinic acid a,c-diamide adenosyltransferase [Dehalococcoidia bacterium]|nr:cob(I)yrinic acid a,c-diamide adenosyltransferase [Dehalococcoidia bacterium]